MQLLRAVVHVDQEHIVEKQVLDKIIFIKPLLVGYDQILNLADRHTAKHVGIL